MTTSPRFPERCARLKGILTSKRLQLIWKDHIRQALRQQTVGDLSDYYDIHLDLPQHIENVTDRIFRGVYQPNVPVRVLFEKSKGLCRQLLIPDPIDALVLQAMVNSILNEVLKNQPNDNAYYQAQAHKITKGRQERIAEGDYGSQQSWLSFQKAALKFTKTHDYLVVTDIANFFDYVSFEELRGIYGSFEGVNEDVLDFIFFILEHYNWRPDYMPDRQIGLPQMNFDAPRLLAHSFLFELDRYLTKKAVGSYARYMDDMDIGVQNVGEGKRLLRDIDLVLQTRGVRLNSGKSRILTAKEAERHYFVRDNDALNAVERAVDRKVKAKKVDYNREISFVSKKFEIYSNTIGYFDQGNGEKIIKRFLTFFIQHKVAIPDAGISSLLYGRPALREYVLHYLCVLGYSPRRYDIVRDYLLSGECVDDASVFAAVRTIIDFGSPNSVRLKRDVRNLADELAKRGTVGFASALWLHAKFGTQDGLIKLIKDHHSVWSIDIWTGRQVGALMSRLFSNAALSSELLELVRSSRNAGAQAVYSLHRRILRGSISTKAIFPYLKALNPSHPRLVTLPKILLLRTFMKSPANASQKSALAGIYRAAPLDSVEKYLLKGMI